MNIVTFLLSIIFSFGLYPKTAIVTEVNNTYIEGQDANGNLWEVSNNAEDWAVGDAVSMIMYDNGTEIIYDDIILSFRGVGY